MWEFKWSAKIGQKKIPRFAGEFLIKYRVYIGSELLGKPVQVRQEHDQTNKTNS
jgi:hypothetical protein